MYTESGMLVGYDVILVFRIDGLEMWWDVDLVGGQLVLAEVFEEIRVAGSVHVHVGVRGVFILTEMLVNTTCIRTPQAEGAPFWIREKGIARNID